MTDSNSDPIGKTYDVVAIAAHPDDLEAVLGGTVVRLVQMNHSVLFVDMCDGEPSRFAAPGIRREQAMRAADILGVDRTILSLKDRLLVDSIDSRIEVALLLRKYKPSIVFTTLGSGVHPDHKAVTDIVVNGVFYARLPKWDEVSGGEVLRDSEPHEISRFFFGHCRMEPPWERFDFAVDISSVYPKKLEALRSYDSVFSGSRSSLLDKYGAEDRYVGSLVNVEYAEAFRSRSPLLVEHPGVFLPSRFG